MNIFVQTIKFLLQLCLIHNKFFCMISKVSRIFPKNVKYSKKNQQSLYPRAPKNFVLIFNECISNSEDVFVKLPLEDLSPQDCFERELCNSMQKKKIFFGIKK